MGRFVLTIVASFGAASVLGLSYWALLVLLQPLLDRARILVHGMPNGVAGSYIAVDLGMAPDMTARVKELLTASSQSGLRVQKATDLGVSRAPVVLHGVTLQSAGELLLAEQGYEVLKPRGWRPSLSGRPREEKAHFWLGIPASLTFDRSQQPFAQPGLYVGCEPKNVSFHGDAERKLIDGFSKSEARVYWIGRPSKKPWGTEARGPLSERSFEKRLGRIATPRFADN